MHYCSCEAACDMLVKWRWYSKCVTFHHCMYPFKSPIPQSHCRDVRRTFVTSSKEQPQVNSDHLFSETNTSLLYLIQIRRRTRFFLTSPPSSPSILLPWPCGPAGIMLISSCLFSQAQTRHLNMRWLLRFLPLCALISLLLSKALWVGGGGGCVHFFWSLAAGSLPDYCK